MFCGGKQYSCAEISPPACIYVEAEQTLLGPVPVQITVSVNEYTLNGELLNFYSNIATRKMCDIEKQVSEATMRP